MEMNSSAIVQSATETNNQATFVEVDVQQTTPAAQTTTVTEETKAIEPIKRTMEELIEELNNLSGDEDLWYLTYMLHEPEVLALKEQLKTNVIRFECNFFCNSNETCSRLKNVAACVAAKKSNNKSYYTSWSVTPNNLKKLCTNCQDKIAFCPHRVAAYIEDVCKNSNLDKNEVYRSILGERYKEKLSFKKHSAMDIPENEYNFIDAVCATAAVSLLKMQMIHISAETDDRVLYSYLPLCERSKRSFIRDTLDYYRCKSGKNDFISKKSLRESVDENRNCSDCIFPQCPDKIAAYFLTLSKKYNVDVFELADFVISTNKIKGITLRGNFRYYQNLSILEKIPFTEESRKTINNIIRYIVNKYTNTNSNVPHMAFNIALITKDDKLANETVEILKDTLWYFDYYKVDKLALVEYNFSEGGLNGLIKRIKAIENPTIIHIKEMSLLAAEESSTGNKNTMQMAQLVNLIEQKKDVLNVVVSGEKSKIEGALSTYPDFYPGVLSYRLVISDMSTVKIVQEIISELQKSYKLEAGFEPQLDNFVISKYSDSPLKSKAFIQSVVQTIIFNHYNKELNADDLLLVKDIPLANNRRSDEEIWRDFNALTGLETVKSEIHSVEQLLKFQKKLQSIGANTSERPNMHMIFSGNPGTGKTTVARLIAEILYNVGFIKQNKFVEVSSKDLIGRYIGQTAPKTAAVCESAYGGVLFIDEAYELTVKGNSTGTDIFRSECISELIKQMEDNRDKLIVIFAGYTKEMQELIKSNAGFASRIGRIIEFEDYTTDQLVDIFTRLVYKNGMKISENAKQTLVNTIQSAKNVPDFGNARYIRNLYENTIMEHAKNMVNVDDVEALVEIQDIDIPAV